MHNVKAMEITPKGHGIIEVFWPGREVPCTWFPNVRTGKGGFGILCGMQDEVCAGTSCHCDNFEAWFQAAMHHAPERQDDQPEGIKIPIHLTLDYASGHVLSWRHEPGVWCKQQEVTK